MMGAITFAATEQEGGGDPRAHHRLNLFLTGLSVLLRDVLVRLDTGSWAPLTVGELRYDFDRSSLDLVQAVVERDLPAFVWDRLVLGLLSCWAFAGLVMLGALILLASYRRVRRRRSLHRTIGRSGA